MAKRKYGNKVKHTKTLYKVKKSGFRKFMEIALTVVLVGGLAVVGYAVGKPLIEFFSGERTPSVEDNSTWTPPEESSVIPNTDTTKEATPAETPATTPEPISQLNGKTAFTPNSALQNNAALSSYVAKLKADGYENAVIELKDMVGNLWYKSELDGIRDSDYIKGSLTIKQICTVFENSGIKVTARINTLLDQVAPDVLDDVSYRFADGSSRWIDARIEKGGKKWANPFLQGTKDYIKKLTAEISNSGIKDIIIANTIFPNMSSYDVSVLPTEVSNKSTRYSSLVDIYKLCKTSLGEGNILIEAGIIDVVQSYAGLNATAEILRGKNELTDASVLLIINRSEIGTELKTGDSITVTLPTDPAMLINTLIKQAERNLGSLKIIPCLNEAEYTKDELVSVEAAIIKLGYSEFIIR